jgi:ATP-dependent helicase IRC3
MNLYPYQKKIFDDAIIELKDRNSLMIVVPTGGGKTVIFSHLIKKMGLKTLIVAHTRELIAQCEKTLNTLEVKNADVFTIQKCYMPLDRVEDYDFLVIDECHRSCSISYLKLIEKFKNKKLLGVTATPFRSDGQWLSDIYGKKISPLSLIDMIEVGLLSDFEGYRVKTNSSLRGVSHKQGDFVASKLASIINVKNRNELIVKEYNNIAPGEKALCFAVNINHALDLESEFKINNISCAAVHGYVTPGDRKKIIKSFKEGDLKVLINCQILTEGFDEPSITCLLMARPTLSKVLYMQMIGRGSRIFPGKKICKVIEFTDNQYDVCCLEELVLSSNRKLPSIDRKESIKEYHRRAKQWLEETQNTIVEQYKPVPKAIYERPATPWQLNFLKKIGVPFTEPISEMQANYLIKETANA